MFFGVEIFSIIQFRSVINILENSIMIFNIEVFLRALVNINKYNMI